MTTISNFLKTSREKAGLTQAEVAQKLGYMTAQFISNAERNVSRLPAKSIRKLAKLYKFELQEYVSMIEAEKIEEIKKQIKNEYFK